MNYELVISDWDGVLLDSLALYYRAVEEIFREYGIKPPSLEEYRNNISPDFMQFYKERGFPPSATSQGLNAIRKRYFEAHWQEVQLRAGARELLTFCNRSKIIVFLATSEVYEIGLRRFNDLRIRHLIHGWARGGNSRYEDLADILACASGISRNVYGATLYLDDTGSGIKQAKSKHLRLKTVGVNGGFNSREAIEAAKPDFIVSSPHEVIVILERGQVGNEG